MSRFGSNPYTFRRWLAAAGQQQSRHRDFDRRLVFVNAWNEWSEGAVLEPSDRFGSRYLLAVRDVTMADPNPDGVDHLIHALANAETLDALPLVVDVLRTPPPEPPGVRPNEFRGRLVSSRPSPKPRALCGWRTSGRAGIAVSRWLRTHA